MTSSQIADILIAFLLPFLWMLGFNTILPSFHVELTLWTYLAFFLLNNFRR